MAAAVADYKPANPSNKKIKKSGASLSLDLKKTPDILHELGKHKTNKQFLVGFALETDDELNNARKKMENKNLDLIVLNSLNDEGAGFGHKTNKVTFLSRDGKAHSSDLKSKQEIAEDLCELIKEQMNR
jgi:phosphopantothenoylcysteine decarboxylase/phosphopantothenate--cysteine ligase